VPDVQVKVAATGVSTKAPSLAGAQMILSLTSRLTCSSTGYPWSLVSASAVYASAPSSTEYGPLTPLSRNWLTPLGNGFRVLADVGEAASSPDCWSPDGCPRCRSGIALEDVAVLGKGDLARCGA